MKFPSQQQYLNKLGKNVKSIRLKRKLSQAKLCQESDIDISTLSRLERGKLNVSFLVLFKIGRVLDVELKDLLRLT